MGLHESRGKITGASKDLFALWASTRTYWDDATAVKFEETFMLPLEQDVRSATSAMDQMAVVLSRIRRECE